MIKHILLSSIQSAFIGSMLLVLMSLPSFGGLATIFGFIAFPIAFAWCLLLAYPLIRFRQKVQAPEFVYFLVYLFVGFLLGALTPVIFFDVGMVKFSSDSTILLGLYGILGGVSAITAWNYGRKHVAL